MRWFLDLMYRGAERTYGLRAEIDEPEFTAAEAAARLARPVIVLPGTPGPATRSCSSTSCSASTSGGRGW